ncbi:MAG: hypothetical protein KME26_23310 [Oscillatoria princeps RMCB-10]|nr:hypothetical protein [Oscillatoria princeps RMCB-10]
MKRPAADAEPVAHRLATHRSFKVRRLPVTTADGTFNVNPNENPSAERLKEARSPDKQTTIFALVDSS